MLSLKRERWICIMFLVVLGAPIVMTFPHFYGASPKYSKSVAGLKPKKKDHGTFITLEKVITTMKNLDWLTELFSKKWERVFFCNNGFPKWLSNKFARTDFELWSNFYFLNWCVSTLRSPPHRVILIFSEVAIRHYIWQVLRIKSHYQSTNIRLISSAF